MLYKQFAILALAAAPLAALAQPPGPRMLDIDRLAIILELDSYQQTEVERILEAQREAMRSMFSQTGERPSREQMHAAREASRTEVLTQLQAVLSAGQIEKFEALTEFDRGGRGGRGRHRDAVSE